MSENGKRKFWERKGTAYDLRCKSFMEWPQMAASQLFVDDAIADGSIRMNSEVYRAILPAQIQPNAEKGVGWCFRLQMDNNSRCNVKANQMLLKAQKWDVMSTQQRFGY